MKRALLAAVMLAMAWASAAEEPDAIYREGIARLRDAQGDHAALVPATKLLAQAAALHEAAGDEAKTAEVNACLYWAKKKMTLADTETLKRDAEVSQRLAATAKAVPLSEAKALLEKADAFAQGHAHDPLLTAIRYFEIADRFPESPEGRKAMSLTLAAMQKVGEKAKLAEYKPAATDGKAFIQSEPAGAAIIIVDADGKKDTGRKTPSLIQLPKGRQTLVLILKGFKPVAFDVYVVDAIAKPDKAMLVPKAIPADVVFEDGWAVFIDGKPARAVGAGKAETPCTAELPVGGHELSLAKEGFMDIKQRIEVAEGGLMSAGGLLVSGVDIKQKASKGTSALLISERGTNAKGPFEKGKEYAVPGERRPMAATVFANGDDSFELCVNGEKIAAGGGNVVRKAIAISLGDVITVKILNTGGDDGFACVIKLKELNRAITSRIGGWKHYSPITATKWSLPSEIAQTGGVRLGTNQAWKNKIVEASGTDCESIWSDSNETVSYLVLKVTEECFLPTK